MVEGTAPLLKGLGPIQQIGIVVKDVDKAVAFYSSTFGWGPWRLYDVHHTDSSYRGKQCSCRLRIALASPPPGTGQLEIELIQPIEGDSPHADFLKERGKE